ncbi:Kynurenine formamidase [Danaus plexippus plexippus]|uniref:Kynurenine formamidase n=1 Tax=Danaus plexippus plexippus TaxID=278856 RepID=A0A212FBP4_DANPL|nr:kynurenine formamidase-like [Danaus plexippus plexippus]OWR51138.1 Kynurenine formamidase [Danaus plexippus plexippus]
MVYPAVASYSFALLLFVLVEADTNLNDILFSGDYNFFDLTHPFDENTVYWPGNKQFAFTRKQGLFQKDNSWYAANDFEAGEHGGTHIDAPYHFQVNGKHVGDIPTEKLIVPLIIADVSSKVNDDSDFVLYKHHLDFMLNDNFGKPCVVIFKFGWSKFINDKKKYLGENKTTNFPGLSAEVAEWITSSYKNIIGVGVDTASVDPGSSTDFDAHKILTKSGLYMLENVKLDENVPDYGCTALILPMKIAKGTGAPLRLVAICPKVTPTNF